MTAWSPQTVRRIFAGLVPDEVAAAYERLLEAGGVPEGGAAGFFGDKDAVKTLTSLGMATVYAHPPGSPPMVDPVDPDLAIQGVLNSMQAQALELQQLLAEGTRRAMEAHGMRGASASGRSLLAEVLTDRAEIIRMSGAVINDARRDFMEVDSLRRDTAISEDMIIAGPQSVEVTHRAIYDQAFVQDAAGRKFIRACEAAGQQARWRPAIRTKMQIADTSTALVALTLTGMGGALLTRSEPAVSALREYFELLWETAIPVTGPAPADGEGPLTPRQREILDLLSAGFSHDRIAGRLKRSPTTVHRQITAIYQMLGVKTPFQAGAAAHRNGWVS